jgi:hypothetical protein
MRQFRRDSRHAGREFHNEEPRLLQISVSPA